MKILIPVQTGRTNEYVTLLKEAYETAGHEVTLGESHFLHPDVAPDVLHIQWPEGIYKWTTKLPLEAASVELIEQQLRWFREHSCRIVYTVHNYAPHEFDNESVETLIYAKILEHADLVLHHGTASVRALGERFPGLPDHVHKVVPHGAYPTSTFDAQQARKTYRLPQDKYCLLNFGWQRPYKGANFIQAVFSGLDRSDWHLFTIGPYLITSGNRAGRFLHKVRVQLNNRCAGPLNRARGRTTIWRNVDSQEVPQIMAAADIVFLGHQRGLNSGILALAASYARPVVYPDIGNFSEQIDSWPWKEAYTAGDIESARAALQKLRSRLAEHRANNHALGDNALNNSALDNSAWKEANTWAAQVQTVIASV